VSKISFSWILCFLVKKDIKTGEILGFENFNLLPLKEGEEIPEVKFVVKEKV
jgi:hypothetical protein